MQLKGTLGSIEMFSYMRNFKAKLAVWFDLLYGAPSKFPDKNDGIPTLFAIHISWFNS